MTTNPLAARFAGEPALIERSMGERFESCLMQAAASADFEQMMAERADAGDDFWPQPDSWQARYRPYVVKDGVLHIPVKGVLLHDFPYALGDWATGYDYVWQAFKRGCGDYVTGTIKGIALVCDTPGGMVAGCFDTVDRMVALKEQVGVPVRGFAHEMAYSAGYAIISVADHIAVSRTGGVGSIGVVTSHLDASGAYEKMGLKITFIFAGKHKVDGNATEPLPDDVKARIQTRIDELYDVFVSAVARNRGMDEQAVRDTEALTFTATQATSNGLADSIGSLEDAMSAFAGFLDDPSNNNGEEAMADANASAVDQAALDAAREEGRVAGHAAGLTEGATTMQERIGAILSSEEAEGREDLAKHFAFKSNMSAEDAVAALAAAPAAAAPAAETPANSFETAMSRGNPEVGAEARSEGGDDEGDDVASLRALAANVGLRGFAKK